MGLLNPTLVDPGPTPGSSAHWTLTSSCSAQRIAAFGPPPERAVEDFERWSWLVTVFPDGALVLAFFDPVPKGYEAFDAWAGGTFLEAFPEVLLDACSFGGAAVEGFTWLSGPWAATWGDVTPDTALFGGASADDFEAWSAPVLPAWAGAAFDAGAAAAESFAGSWAVMKTL